MTGANPRAAELARCAAEWEALALDTDPDRRRARKDELIAWKARICAEDEQSLVTALAARGFGGTSVWDLVNTKRVYPELIATLRDAAAADHLPPVREGIFRALTVRESGEDVFDVLVDQWRKSMAGEDRNLRWVLANAISVIVPRKRVTELARLIDGNAFACDPLVRRLRKSDAGRKALAAIQEKAAA